MIALEDTKFGTPININGNLITQVLLNLVIKYLCNNLQNTKKKIHNGHVDPLFKNWGGGEC